MWVKMITMAAGPDGVLQANQKYDLPATQALTLIDGGYAEPAKAPRETATVQPEEMAVEVDDKPPARSKAKAKAKAEAKTDGDEVTDNAKS